MSDNNAIPRQSSEELKEKMISSLRENIISNIPKYNITAYELASLPEYLVSRCFPNSEGCCTASFKINLVTMELFAVASGYPNQFGESRNYVYRLSAGEFNEKAVEYYFPRVFQIMQTEEDWKKLFNDDLKKAVKDKMDEKEAEERKLYALVIPKEFQNMQPKMDIEEISLILYQKYGRSNVKIIKKNGIYAISYSERSADSYETTPLSAAEAVWLEHVVDEALNNDDETIWQSMPGGDSMTVIIRKTQKLCIYGQQIEPLNKFYLLKHSIHKLARYGSRFE